MSTGMPELGSKISLISKADIRYEGRLFTVDPQECTIALASVRSFGTEDRETQYPVAPQSQVYDYILFRGSDIKDIRVLNNVPSLPNDPAIMQMSVPPTLGAGSAPGQFTGQFAHPVVGQAPYQQYHPMGGFPGSVHTQLNKTSSMLDLIGGGSQQNASRSTTPAVGGHRKSPTADQGTQVGTVPSGSGQQRDSRRGSGGGAHKAAGAGGGARRNDSRTRQRYPSGGTHPHHQNQHQHQQNQQQNHQQQNHQQQNHQQHQPGQHQQNQQGQHQQNQQGQNQHPGQMQQGQYHNQHNQHGQNYNRGGWRGRARGRGRGFVPRNKNTLKFENDYDFEQANTEFEELRSQLAKTKISDEVVVKPEDVVPVPVGEVDKKDDSGNETGADVPEVDDDPYTGYDKTKSFFDNISCEAIERSKGRSQRTDWRTERKLNSETFGVASARRGNWRGRGNWRHNPHHQPMSYFPSWRGNMRGGRGRPNNMNPHANMPRINQPRNAGPPQQVQAQPPAAAAK